MATEQKIFERKVQLIRKGYVCLEVEARELAADRYQHMELDAALMTGAATLYRDYLALISEGQTEEYAGTALRHAKRFKFEIGPLEEAVSLGELARSKRTTIIPKGE